MDDAIAPPQVLNVMPIWCDTGVHLGETAVTADQDGPAVSSQEDGGRAECTEPRQRTAR